MRWRLVYFIARWEDNTICRGLIHNMFKIPKFRDFDWVFRYFNYEFHNEVKACIFHRLVGESHKYVVHTSFRIGYFVCKNPLWGVDTTPCINGQTYLEHFGAECSTIHAIWRCLEHLFCGHICDDDQHHHHHHHLYPFWGTTGAMQSQADCRQPCPLSWDSDEVDQDVLRIEKISRRW